MTAEAKARLRRWPRVHNLTGGVAIVGVVLPWVTLGLAVLLAAVNGDGVTELMAEKWARPGRPGIRRQSAIATGTPATAIVAYLQLVVEPFGHHRGLRIR